MMQFTISILSHDSFGANKIKAYTFFKFYFLQIWSDFLKKKKTN